MSQHWQCSVLQAGKLKLDGGSMFGVVPRPLWSKMTTPDDRNRIELQTNCLLLESEDRRVLVETGCGDKWSDKQRDIYGIERRTVLDALKEQNVDPESINAVIVTHLHFDHGGGLTRFDGEGVPMRTFTEASVHVQCQEWEDALAGKSTMNGTYLRSHLDPIHSCVQLTDGECEVFPGISVLPVPGHTWGQQAVLVETLTGIVCFPGDLMPTRHHVGAPYSMGYDMMPFQNMQTKRRLLDRAADESWTLVLDHEPDTPVVAVHRTDEWFELEPVRNFQGV